VLAVLLSAAHKFPLGSLVTNRYDTWLLPWVGVMVALALTDLARVAWIRDRVRATPPEVRVVVAGAAAVVLAVLLVSELGGYKPVRAQPAAAALVNAPAAQPTYLSRYDWPVQLLLPGPIRLVTDRGSETDFDVARSRPRHLDDKHAAQAAQELRAACGQTVTIVGVAREPLAAILRDTGCAVRAEQFTANGTSLPFDDVAVVRLAPR
jgi:hypothetical protein